jgi:hypothetical protein
MCPLERLIIVTGELAPVFKGALGEANCRVAAAYKAGNKQVHADQTLHVWIADMVGREELSVPPFVRLR